MKWIEHYQLFLFDFDGILANTEDLHYKAYIKMCADRGFSLKWDLKTYVHHAMFHSTALKEAIYAEFPKLKEIEPSWEILYREKTEAYLSFLENEVALMPHVEILLKALQEKEIKRCVVTHSSKLQVSMIQKKHPILNSIPIWITREDYRDPKPSSECYEKAIRMLADEKDHIIGFEDSPRGLKALLGTRAEGIMITPYFQKSDLVQEIGKDFSLYASFEELFLNKKP